MKRYIVFTGDQYYPGCGWNDFRESFEEVEEALEYLLNNPSEWSQVVDLKTGYVIKQYQNY